ncbi:GNAT family N-acetyltransferase [Flavobacterium sp. W21_SRS_FM6]|uniref:GNAT family N-acetyltransferase n=1 Tax=Flavobacterium sp. W21_SRS_FM6 TaxID=3240268 RepID=UPI003F8E62A1
MLSDASIIQFWLATLDSALVGCFSVTQNYLSWSVEPYLHLDCLFLHQDYRQQGLGSRLFTEVKSIAASLNLKQIQWQTPVENTKGVDFYVRQGAGYSVKSRFTLNE